jgi:hypothetical protein
METEVQATNRRKSSRKWRQAHSEEFKQALRKHVVKTKTQAFAILGNKCSNVRCGWLNEDGSQGCTDSRCLQIDHINDDGYVERKNGIHGTVLYRRIINGIDVARYQLLCANCNWIKKFQKAERGQDGNAQ